MSVAALAKSMEEVLLEYGENRAICFTRELVQKTASAIAKCISDYSSQETRFSSINNDNLLIMGDIHGDLKTFVQTLWEMELVDDFGNWKGKDRSLIQLGDFVDKGDSSFECYLYLKTLQKQADLAGEKGKVTILLGTHEKFYLENMQLHFYKTFAKRFWLTLKALKISDIANIKFSEINLEKLKEKLSNVEFSGLVKMLSFQGMRKMLKQDIEKGNIVASHDRGNVLFIHGSIGKKSVAELTKRLDAAEEKSQTVSKMISNELNSELMTCVAKDDFTTSVLIGGSHKFLKAAKDGIVHNRDFMDTPEPIYGILKDCMFVVGHMPTTSRKIEWAPGPKQNIMFCDTGLGKGTKSHAFTSISFDKNSEKNATFKISNEGLEPQYVLINEVNGKLEVTSPEKDLFAHHLMELKRSFFQRSESNNLFSNAPSETKTNSPINFNL